MPSSDEEYVSYSDVESENYSSEASELGNNEVEDDSYQITIENDESTEDNDHTAEGQNDIEDDDNIIIPTLPLNDNRTATILVPQGISILFVSVRESVNAAKITEAII